MYYYLTIRSNLPSLTSKIDSPNRETCATCPSCNQLSTRAYSSPPTFEIRVRSKRAGEIWFARGGGSVCLSQKAEWCPRSRAKPATLVYVVSRRCFLPLAALFAILDPTIRPRQLLVSSYSATLPTLSTSLLSINYWRYLRGFWKILFDERWRGRSIIFLLFFFLLLWILVSPRDCWLIYYDERRASVTRKATKSTRSIISRIISDLEDQNERSVENSIFEIE